MFSPTKAEDKKFLLELAELITTLARLEEVELAEKFGQHYLELEQKINTHDYTKDDEDYYLLIEITSCKRTPSMQ